MIISLGEALIDFVSQEDMDFRGFPGGSPYNTSIAIARQGIACQFLGRISLDLFGNQLVDYLKKNEVKTDLSLRTNDPTTLSFIKKQPDGQASYAFFATETADKNWKKKDLASIVLPPDTRIIHFGSISITQEPCGTILSNFLLKKGKDYILSFDPNIRPSLVPDRNLYMERFQKLCEVSSILKLSDEDLDWLYPDIDREQSLQSILDLGIDLIALTEGKAGARMVTKSYNVLAPGYILPVADTIGAGDTFHGALLSSLHRKKWFDRKTIRKLSSDQLLELGKYATKAAGINCHRSGANPPTLSEMQDPIFQINT